jgi:hypothetical protein
MDYSIGNGCSLGQTAEHATERGHGLESRFTAAVAVFPHK